MYTSLIILLLFSCEGSYDYDRMNFKEPDKIYSLMEEQIQILEKIENKAYEEYLWKITDSIFVVRGINVDTLNDSLKEIQFNSWNITVEEYKKLEANAYELDNINICGVYMHQMGIYAFRYYCNLQGFDIKERKIYLKREVNELSFFYNDDRRVILDENEKMILVY